MSALAKDDFRRGRKFRVVKEGASIGGMQPDGPGIHRPCSINLPMGMVITCQGWGMTMGDGTPVVKWADEQGQAWCMDAEFRPRVGDWVYSVPDTDYLVPLD